LSTSVIWFRRDLRLADNPALLGAVDGADDVVALFVLDDALWVASGAARRAFLLRCLRALDESIGGRLVVRRGDPVEVVRDTAAEVGAADVFCAEDFGPYGGARDERVEVSLARDGRALVRSGSPYAVPPGEVRSGSGEPYKVFTPFSKAWASHGWPAPSDAPRAVRWVDGGKGDELPAEPDVAAVLPEAGEAAAQRAASTFLESGIEHYGDRRDDPGADATSRLSPYLKWGCIHPRQLLCGLGRTPGASAFRAELCWREFYADVLHHRPDTARRAFTPKMAAMRVDEGKAADERFAAWAEGRTGYPIVDAGMRQLQAEAWMHNRVRMITASFLVKDLHIDWTRGARHFLDLLVDGDLASNTPGWQWTAGTGTDASPSFRVFNPVSQSKRFDPHGEYIRRWVPELRDVDGVAVHEPWKLPGGPPAGYPAPIVDHAAERLEALRRYDDVRGSGSG
jgi:deoxyribodipyrimidine photo-lyase